MMSWNYRIIRDDVHYEDDLGEDEFAIHECYYDKGGNIKAVSRRPVQIWMDHANDLDVLVQLIGAFEKPTLSMRELNERFKKQKQGETW